MPSWWKRTSNYLSSHSNLFVVTGGILGGAYLLSHYAIAKFQEIQDKLISDKTAKENLRRRFAQNQEDCTFTVLALLPTVGDQLSSRLNVEQLTESLRAHSTAAAKQTDSPASEAASQPTAATGSEVIAISAANDASASTNDVPISTTDAPTTTGAPITTDAPITAGDGSVADALADSTASIHVEQDVKPTPSRTASPSGFNPLAKEFVPAGARSKSPDTQASRPGVEGNTATQVEVSAPVPDAETAAPSSTTTQPEVLDSAIPASTSTTDQPQSTDVPPNEASGQTNQVANDAATAPEASDGAAPNASEALQAKSAEAESSAAPLHQQVPEPPNRERLVQERQAKLKLWNELKIVSFSRTVTSLYCVALLTLQTHIQLNLIGRFAYLASIETQARPSSANTGSASSDKASNGAPSHDDGDQFRLDLETERLYLTYSWWFLHRGWDALTTRVVKAIEHTLSGLPVKAQITMDELRALIGSARSSVEHELLGDSTKRSNFLDVLFPVTEEQELEALLRSGAAAEDEAQQVLQSNRRLRLLLDETKDIIESADFSSVLQLCLDRVFEVFFNTMAPTFGVQPTSASVAIRPFESEGFSGARIEEVDDGAQKGRSVRLATLFPAVARQGQLAIHGVPNEYIESLADSKELRAFSAVIYSAWPQGAPV
ncbi:peroxin [Thecaphora frezii]